MIEKICEVIDGEYICDIDISVEEWKILLKNKKVFDEKSIAALKKWFIEPNHSCTCFDIGKKYDLHSMSANGVINGLGGRVQKELGRFEVKGIGNIAAGTKFLIEPHIRFEGEIGEQATMFFYDPSGNALEFKAFADANQIFAH